MRGGERVLEQILKVFPDADIFTHVLDLDSVSEQIRSYRIEQSFVSRLPGARKHYQKYLSFMPRALEEFDLSEYDLVISSESGPAKGVLVPPKALHVCYCHTPMRYLYDHYPRYRNMLGPVQRMYFSHLAHRLRQWDFASAARIDAIFANSSFTADRIRRFWGREARVVYPPVDLSTYAPGPGEPGDYYLAASELVAYKQIDRVIEAFRGFDRRLIVAGGGEKIAEYRRTAPPNVDLRGRVTQDELRALYRGAKALIFPGEEDFGIVPLEAMACGTPVIAYGSGGALETVVSGRTGLHFSQPTTEGIRSAILEFERRQFDSRVIAEHAKTFSNEVFRDQFTKAVEEAFAARSRVAPSRPALRLHGSGTVVNQSCAD